MAWDRKRNACFINIPIAYHRKANKLIKVGDW